jgi:hypothetical protein
MELYEILGRIIFYFIIIDGKLPGPILKYKG